jgi:hypothetical protein
VNAAQTRKYWWEWSRAREFYLGRGLTHEAADAKRHELHRKALGRDKSSKSFSNADLDKVIAAFRAVWDGGNLDAQLRQIEQPEQRLRELHARIARLAEACGVDGGDEGLAAYLKNFLKGRSFAGLGERELQQVAGILERRAKQLAPTEDRPF